MPSNSRGVRGIPGARRVIETRSIPITSDFGAQTA